MLKLGWFSSGRGPGSRNLLKSVMDEKLNHSLNVEIQFIFCNWDNAEDNNPKKEEREKFFAMADEYGIPLVTLSWKTFKPELRTKDEERWRELYGKEMRHLISEYDFDLGILAGYMLWVDDETCEQFDLLNLHPALPDGPKGTWQEVIWELISKDAKEQGAMMHMCTRDWDRGDAISYCGFSIRGHGYDELWENMSKKLTEKSLRDIIKEEDVNEPLFKKIREDGAKRELPLVVSTIRQFADGNIMIKNKQLYSDGHPLDGAFDVSEDVNRTVK